MFNLNHGATVAAGVRRALSDLARLMPGESAAGGRWAIDRGAVQSIFFSLSAAAWFSPFGVAIGVDQDRALMWLLSKLYRAVFPVRTARVELGRDIYLSLQRCRELFR